MLKQLTPSAAIEAGQNGKPVVVIMTTPEHDKVKWVSLQDLLDGCIFLAEDQAPEADREPEKEKPEPGSTPPPRSPGRAGKLMSARSWRFTTPGGATSRSRMRCTYTRSRSGNM